MAYTWSTALEAFEEFKQILGKPCSKGEILSFRHKLNVSLTKTTFRTEMAKYGALINWDEDSNRCYPHWTENTIKDAVKAIESHMNSPSSSLNPENDADLKIRRRRKLSEDKSEPEKPQINVVTTPRPATIMEYRTSDENSEGSGGEEKDSQLLSKTGYNLGLEKKIAPSKPQLSQKPIAAPRNRNSLLKPKVALKSEWHNLIGKSLEFLDPMNYIKIKEILQKPTVNHEHNQPLASLLPFILQKIQMWSGDILFAHNLSELISMEEPNWSDEETEEKNTTAKSVPTLSKLDILTLLMATAEVTVLADIFQNISKYPISLPLILPNPVKNTNSSYIMVTAALEKCQIKWEHKGKHGQNYLFKNLYKLITAIRIGNNESVGKSTILNQIFVPSNVFQCRWQHEGGKPISLNGSVEFIWLTKDTCKEAIWTTIQAEMKDVTENEIVLMANLHGDALEFEDSLKAMHSITSKYIVFAMPDKHLDDKMKKLENICGKENILYLFVDPDPNMAVDKLKTLTTTYIASGNEALNKLKLYISRALKTYRSISDEIPHSQSIIQTIPEISVKDSKDFLELLHQLVINSLPGSARNLLKLQKITKTNHDQFWPTYKNSLELQKLMTKFATLLQIPLLERRLALAHIEQELSIISVRKFNECSSKLTILLRKRNSSDLHDSQMLQINEEISNLQQEFENSLSLQDILRELSIVFESILIYGRPQEISLFSKLPALYAELLLEGRTLEILDGDSGSVPGIWLESVCHSVCQKLSNLKVFIISILGLQSSGKSTLLNALFGCKFATSVGKCTKGLYLRLILLEESFKQQLGLDAILVVDTEGLGSPESMLDPMAESKDRTMATYAMTISNLTLINVAGESNKEMVNILQIVILTMARMDRTDLSPDILLVQQVPEGGHEVQLAKGVDNFCNALEEAVKVIQSKDIDLGVKTLKNLKTLKQRLRLREILYQLRPFKSGASPQSPPTEEYCQDIVGLRKRIIQEFCNKKKNFIYFCTWHKLLKGYWEAVQKENFALRFTSIRQVQEFIEVNIRTASVKNDMDMAFQYHQRSLSENIHEKLNLLNDAKVTNEFETSIQELINSQLDLVPKRCQTPLQITTESVSCKFCRRAEDSRIVLLEFVQQTSGVSVNDVEENLNAHISDLKEIAKAEILKKFESIKIQLGKASEFETILVKIIRDLKLNVEIRSVEEIWEELLKVVQKIYSIRFVKSQVIEDIVNAYMAVPDVVRWKIDLTNMSFMEADPRRTLAVLNVKKKKILRKANSPDLDLTTNEHSWLCEKFQEVAEYVVSNKKQERQGYTEFLALDHKQRVANILHSFEERFKTRLKPQFKFDSIFYSLQLFLQSVLQMQDEWNREFEPYFILLRQKNEYLKKISIHLGAQSPLQIIGFGSGVAKKLLEAALLICTSTFDITKYMSKWASKAESIRLRYFVSLAEDLRCGNDSVVMGHFQNPTVVHSEWYTRAIELSLENIVTPLVQEAFLKECGEIEVQIDRTKSMQDLLVFTNWYLHKVGDHVQLHSLPDDMHQRLKEEILKHMSKTVKDYSEEIKMDFLPVNYDTCFDNLGCMVTCPGCAALCWGSKNHENGISKFKLHFTCHQPKGLAGVIDEKTGQLQFRSCCQDSNAEAATAKCDNEVEEVQWLKEEHPIDEYNQLMNWFFLKLKDKLANQFGVTTVSEHNLEDDNRLTLLDREIDNILNLLRHKSAL